MATRAYWIEGPWSGRLAIVPRPRGGDWLDDEVSGWRESGIDVVASFLTPAEAAEFDLENEGEVCKAHGIRFVSFPIPDQEVPISKPAVAVLLHDLEQALVGGKNVALHCRQSVGRSATIAAALFVAAGAEPRIAFEKIGNARGCKVPETAEQERWVADFAYEMSTHPALSRQQNRSTHGQLDAERRLHDGSKHNGTCKCDWDLRAALHSCWVLE